MKLTEGSIRAGLVCAFFVAASAGVRAQVVFPESEPNDDKVGADVIDCIDELASITGTVASGEVDVFRIRTCTRPLGIYRYTLADTAFPVTVQLSIRGLPQTNGVIGTGDVAVQTQGVSTSTPGVTWYGFGRGEDLYVSVTATGASASYDLRLTLTPISAQSSIPTLLAGPVTLDAQVSVDVTDGEFWIYDADFQPIPGFANDDSTNLIASKPRLTRSFAPGTYYVAYADANLANHQPSPPDDLNRNRPVLDFAGAVVSSDGSLFSDFQYRVSDGMGSQSVIFMPEAVPYQVLWNRIVVAEPPYTTCTGAGGVGTCPCGNTGAPGNGCASSFQPAGANLAASGTASISSDSLTLTATNVSVAAATLFQGTQSPSTTFQTFGDGRRCVGGSVLRMGTVFAPGGLVSYPAGVAPALSVTGVIPSAGGVRAYQVWYRDSPAFCTSATFNLTNGVVVRWTP